MAEATLLEVVKALYGLPTSGNRWRAHLLNTLRSMIFKPTHFDPDVWIMRRTGGYDYIGTHTNNILAVSFNPTFIFNKLKYTYTIKAFGASKVYLIFDYSQDLKGANTWWVMGFWTYTVEELSKVFVLLKVASLRKEKLLSSPSGALSHPTQRLFLLRSYSGQSASLCHTILL